jgi:hypothetical protein
MRNIICIWRVNIAGKKQPLSDIDENNLFVNSDVELASDVENADESDSEREAAADLDEATRNEPQHNWSFGVPPVRPRQDFIGASGPRCHIIPEKGLPYDYFCLFIPVWIWTRIATYTNEKANMSQETDAPAHARPWHPTSAAEIKAWFASIIWWCVFKTFTFEQLFKSDMKSTKINQWFPNFRRWTQIKRFLKLSDPRKDKHNIH